ncbi:keratin-associated protein 19-2-like [Mytilus californianus]|uniref:keratin-associated protein 19-2-like n=1 Tax=Mytilus californianus TaxID=6549 RepID=UPI00224521DB|nr:keratin-associated protein 19-2-like [Mytilus californianus]
MTLKAFLCLLLVGLVAAEAGKKGYSPKYNLKTYGNPLGPFFGGNGYQGNSGSRYPLNFISGYGHGGYANNFYGLGSPLHYGSHVGYNSYGTQGGFPGYGFMNGGGLNVLSGYGNYAVHGNGVMPFKGYGFGRRLGGYGGFTNLIGSGAYGIDGINGYRSYGIGGINGYGSYGIGGLNGYGSHGIGGIGGFRNGRYGYNGVGGFGKFGGKKGTY